MTSNGDTPVWVRALLDTTLSPTEYRILSYIFWRQGGNGHAWPSQAMIAADLGLTAEGVRRITKRLQESGWLVVEWSKGPGRGEEHRKQYMVTHPSKTPPAVPVLSVENPNSGLGITAENPTGHTVKTPPAKPRHKGRTLTVTLTSSARTKPPFTPPTVDEVAAYATSRGHPEFDADYFVEHYTTAEWRDVVGNPVGNWKGKVLTWLRRDQERRKAKGEPEQDGYAEFGTHPATIEEAEAALRES